MCTERRRNGLLCSVIVVGGVLVVACADSEPLASPADAGALVDVTTTTTVDSGSSPAEAAAPSICKEGRRRCVGLDLEVCDVGGWGLLQSCLPGEWCDVAVGICRAVDAGADSSPDAS